MAPLGDNIFVNAKPEPLRVVTTYPFEPEESTRIQMAATAPVEIVICRDREEFRERLPEADIVYGDLRAEELPLAGRLRWIQAGAAGLDDLDRAVLESPDPADELRRHVRARHRRDRHGHAAVPDARHQQVLRSAIPQAHDEPGRHDEIRPPHGACRAHHGHRRVGRHRPRGCPQGALRIRDARGRHGRGPGAEAGLRRRASRSLLVHGDGCPLGRAGGGGPAHARDRADVQRGRSSAA